MNSHRSRTRENRPRRTSSWATAALMILLPLGLGCTAWKIPESFSLPGSKPKFEVPNRVTDLWTFSVLNQPGQPGVRGFGGRLMFFTNLEEKPVKVEGTLTVFAFDGQENDPARATPLRKFVFTAEKLTSHYSESKLGHSYSFWLPWDEVGGPEQQVILIARFESKGGQLLVGTPSRQTLAGLGRGADPQQASAASKPPGAKTSSNDVHAVGHQEPVDDAGRRQITAATINIPPNFMRRTEQGATDARATASGAATVTRLPPPTSADNQGQQPAGATQNGANGPAVTSPPPTRSSLERFPARRGPAFGPRTDPVRRQPYPATWPSALPPTPRSGPGAAAPNTTPGAATDPNVSLPQPADYSRSQP